MIKRVIKKLFCLVIVLVILSFLVFALLYIAPGDPAEKRLTSQGVAITKEVLDSERERLGLLKPFLVRYGEWLLCIVRGDFGISFKDDMPVAPKLVAGLRNTSILALTSLFVSLIISFPLAIISAIRKDGITDHIVRLFSFVGNSLPNFLISVLLMYLLCIKLNLFPVIASGNIQGLFMPVVSLAIPMTGRFVRQIRSEFLNEMKEDYIIGMKGRGVSCRYIILNLVHNCLGHVFTIVALQIGSLMSGSVVIETIFRWPGIGKLVMDSITARDYPVIMGFVIIMGTIYVVINQLSDILCHYLDPRTEI
ncbi:ABC transporter permease [Butyrivibrio sp. XBB1001]|uniref:ABC transporter permease n=1 Tax=Butyrivibrio sp. XBB1001 TaxID=1280682 RepID=UPI00042A6C52|nr:ABC transporter permease [Butyrivibrio sp. XBB1001]